MRALGGTAFFLAALGCSVPVEEQDSPVETSTHAIIQIQREQNAAGERGDAIASFVRLASQADPGEALAWAGLRDPRPPRGQCRVGSLAGAIPDGDLTSVELVMADRVSLSSEGGEQVLVPFAFPAVNDWIRGVVYTSRDQSAGALPDGGSYRIEIQGAEGLGDSQTAHNSPKTPASLTIDGLPWEEVASIPTEAEFVIGWDGSESELDVIAVVIESPQGSLTCTFSDADGHGAMDLTSQVAGHPGFTPDTPAHLSVHRIRAALSAAESEEAGQDERGSAGNDSSPGLIEVRFDFAAVLDVVLR